MNASRDIVKTLGQAGLSLVGIAAFFLALLFNSYVLTVLWTWFVLPTFGIATPALVMMFGLQAVCAMFTTRSWSSLSSEYVREQLDKNKTDENGLGIYADAVRHLSRASYVAFGSLALLLDGYIAHLLLK